VRRLLHALQVLDLVERVEGRREAAVYAEHLTSDAEETGRGERKRGGRR
jgi:hypothetical protein